jgi:uncharacterized protein involved in exopolysaccharide biosynthesis
MVALAVVGAVAAVVARLSWPEHYAATATVEVTSTGDATALSMETQRSVAESTGVLVEALSDLSGWSLDDLRTALAVNVPRDADVLEVTVTGDTSKSSAAAANAVAIAYLNDRRTETSSSQRRELKSLEREIAQLEAQIESSAIDARRQVLVGRLATVNAKYSDARAAVSAPGRILSSAEPPSSPTTPGLPVWVLAGLVGGLILGFYAASIGDRMRRSGNE